MAAKIAFLVTLKLEQLPLFISQPFPSWNKEKPLLANPFFYAIYTREHEAIKHFQEHQTDAK